METYYVATDPTASDHVRAAIKAPVDPRDQVVQFAFARVDQRPWVNLSKPDPTVILGPFPGAYLPAGGVITRAPSGNIQTAWAPGGWEAAKLPSREYVAACLIGSGGVALTVGEYVAWVRIIGSPNPLRPLGNIIIK